MKIKILFLLIILKSSAPLLAQVGINTTNPIGVFHIDAGANRPATVSDDVVVDAKGNLGLGTISPTAKVDIQNQTMGNPPLRLVDGNEAVGRVLLSDSDGNASWGAIKGSGSGIQTNSLETIFNQYNPVKYYLDGINPDFTITADGNYLLLIRWVGRTTQISPDGLTSAYFQIYKNNNLTNMIDGIEYYVDLPVPFKGSLITFSVVLTIPNCVVGDLIHLYIIQSVGGGTWSINNPGDTSPSTIIYRI